MTKGKSVFINSLFIIILFSNCNSVKSFEETRLHKNIIEKNPKTISYDQLKTISENDSAVYNEIRFKSTYSMSDTQKVMFDKYGKWDQTLKSENSNGYVLAWKNIRLFNNEKEYIVLASSHEERNNTYASVIVLDINGMDIVENNYAMNQKIALLFGKMIWSNDRKNKKFFDVFYADRDTSHYNN